MRQTAYEMLPQPRDWRDSEPTENRTWSGQKKYEGPGHSNHPLFPVDTFTTNPQMNEKAAGQTHLHFVTSYNIIQIVYFQEFLRYVRAEHETDSTLTCPVSWLRQKHDRLVVALILWLLWSLFILLGP